MHSPVGGEEFGHPIQCLLLLLSVCEGRQVVHNVVGYNEDRDFAVQRQHKEEGGCVLRVIELVHCRTAAQENLDYYGSRHVLDTGI